MLAKIEGVNYTAIIGESAKIDVKQAINYIKSGQAEISETVGDIIGEFNDNAVEKTNTFNQNAIDKTAEFDLNASNKTGAFNTNATNKTTNYNDNATSKTGVFDSNAVDKTNDFNLNASNKTTDFNNNYLEKKALIDAEVAKSKTWAEGTDGEVAPLGGTHSSKGWAKIAEEAASGVQNPANRDLSNLTDAGEYRFDSQNETISNCILEIPQDINLTLENGTLTLKAGSILRMPDNQTRTTTVDRTIQVGNAGNTEYCIFMQKYSASETPTAHLLDRVCSGETDTLAGVNYHVWFDTTNNIIKRYGTNHNTYVECFFPLCIAKTNSDHTSWESITKVFNGAGYIGHHAYVLPNIKTLISDGFNDDGSLKSIEKTKTSLDVRELRTKNNDICVINSSGAISQWGFGYEEATDEKTADFSTMYKRIYIKNENLIKVRNENGISTEDAVIFIEYSYDGTNVTKFDIRQPYEGARNLLTDDIEKQVSTKQVDVTTLTGYDATQTQTLKNINGVLTWVTDGE